MKNPYDEADGPIRFTLIFAWMGIISLVAWALLSVSQAEQQRVRLGCDAYTASAVNALPLQCQLTK